MQSSLIAQNQNWRIRARTEMGEEQYAITKASGRYTFYLYGRTEKLIFYKKLQTIIKSYEESDKKEDLWTLCFDSPQQPMEFCIALLIKDIKFLLEAIPVTEAEKQMQVEEEIISYPNKGGNKLQ